MTAFQVDFCWFEHDTAIDLTCISHCDIDWEGGGNSMTAVHQWWTTMSKSQLDSH